jgi:hypothetical protein
MDAAMVAEIALRKSRGRSLDSWLEGFDALVTKNGRITAPEKLEDHARHATQLLRESKLSRGEMKKRLMEWIKDLRKIHSVFFHTVLNVFGIFRKSAVEIGLNETEFEELRNYFRSTVLKFWKGNASATLAAEAELGTPMLPRELPSQEMP